jgi:hypothetical protein
VTEPLVPNSQAHSGYEDRSPPELCQDGVSKSKIGYVRSSFGCRSPVPGVEVRYRVSKFDVRCRSSVLGVAVGGPRRASVRAASGQCFVTSRVVRVLVCGVIVRWCRSVVSFGGVVRWYRSVMSFVVDVVGWRSRQSIVSPGPESADLVSTSVRRLVLSRRSPAMLRCWCYCYCCRCGGRGFGWLIVGCVIGSWKVEEARGKPEVICNEMAA